MGTGIFITKQQELLRAGVGYCGTVQIQEGGSLREEVEGVGATYRNNLQLLAGFLIDLSY